MHHPEPTTPVLGAVSYDPMHRLFSHESANITAAGSARAVALALVGTAPVTLQEVPAVPNGPPPATPAARSGNIVPKPPGPPVPGGLVCVPNAAAPKPVPARVPAAAAALLLTMGRNWQWSPNIVMLSASLARAMGHSASGSTHCAASSRMTSCGLCSSAKAEAARYHPLLLPIHRVMDFSRLAG